MVGRGGGVPWWLKVNDMVRRRRTRTFPTPSRPPRPPRQESSIDDAASTLTRLFCNPRRFRGPIVNHSGIAYRSRAVLQPPSYGDRGARFDTYAPPLGVLGARFDIDAPPPGDVLWFSLAFDSQTFQWDSWWDPPVKESNQSERVDFGVTWDWCLMANPSVIPDPQPCFMSDGGRYEFHSSLPPGRAGFNAAWIAPARGKTFTPETKDPPLQCLLSTNRNGQLRLWYSYRCANPIINGRSALTGAAITCPITLFYSWAVVAQAFVAPAHQLT